MCCVVVSVFIVPVVVVGPVDVVVTDSVLKDIISLLYPSIYSSHILHVLLPNFYYTLFPSPFFITIVPYQ